MTVLSFIRLFIGIAIGAACGLYLSFELILLAITAPALLIALVAYFTYAWWGDTSGTFQAGQDHSQSKGSTHDRTR